ncbi:MAG: hypothetical protein AAF799_43735 [Myxococcota bacterium]
MGPAQAEPTDPDATEPAAPEDEASPQTGEGTSSAEEGAGTESAAEPSSETETASPPAEEPEPSTAEATTTEPATEAADEPGEVGLDDIFGTSEDHTDVTVISEKGEEPDASTDSPSQPRAAGPSDRRARFRDALDTRIRIVSSVYYDTARVERHGFGRNENRLEFYFSYTPNEHLQIVGDVEPVFMGVAQTQELDDLATRQMLTPFHIESDAAYVALNDVLPNLDIKIGRQTLVWGSADKFNPTNNINPDDLEDRPLFTEPIANQMLVVDYAPLGDRLWFQGVYVPIFYPALLPPSAAAALKDPQAQVPFARQEDVNQLGELQDFLNVNTSLIPTVTTSVKVPRARFSNGQSAVKLGTTLGGVDMSISYYNGRHDIPLPVLAEAGTKERPEGELELPEDSPECCYTSHVTLVYPRMQVIGADFATQLPFLGDMGLWGEGGLFVPQANSIRIGFPILFDVTPDDGINNRVSSISGPTIRSTPYVKATAGLDYSFGEHVYVQGQYLRGFIDEYGADHIGNYIVGGTDLIFFGRHLIFRMFGVVDLPTGRGDEGSYVLFPELIVVPPWGSVTLEMGSFFMLGGSKTKFGQAAAGSSIAFFKVAGQF